MKSIIRACGITAAVLALTATVNFDPVVASEIQGAQPGSNYLSHVAATMDAVETAQDAPATPATTADADPEVRDHLASAMASTMIETLNATLPGEQSLGELVSAYGSATTPNAEQECLAGAVYFEARSEPLQGQLAVADVVINRASSGRYPTTICAVVTQRAQFSFIRNGRFPTADRSSDAWRKAVAIARIARERLANQVAPNVLWYHADYVAPVWRRNLTRVSKIGAHIFYS